MPGTALASVVSPVSGLIVPAGGGVSSLLTDLVAYWKLDEASGTRYDSVGSSHLTDHNTVMAATGKVGDAAQFVRANSEYLDVASNASLVTGDIDFTVSAWVYLDDVAVSGLAYAPVSKWQAASNEYQLWYYNGLFQWLVRDAADTGNKLIAASTGTPSVSTWYWLCAYHDAVNDEIGIGVNNVWTTTAWAQGVKTGAGVFQIGRWDSGQYWDGRVDEVGLWKRLLSTDEKAALYNAGAGVTYPFS